MSSERQASTPPSAAAVTVPLTPLERRLFKLIRHAANVLTARNEAAAAAGDVVPGPSLKRPNENSCGDSSSSSSSSLPPSSPDPSGGRSPPLPPSSCAVIPRVAGGWVRDKILGMESHDIDIALSGCSGVAFATVVKECVESNEWQDDEEGSEANPSGTAAAPAECSRVAVIQANPGQSKHLETATMMVLGASIDFVSLRTETYAQGDNVDNRIPLEVGIGTPEEDAFRRDFTINALFYNINTSSVEDWTKWGVGDLLGYSVSKDGTSTFDSDPSASTSGHYQPPVIRTPLPPLITFLDDPLRLLRGVRFWGRFPGFTLSPDIIEACLEGDGPVGVIGGVRRRSLNASPGKIKRALANKVSRERVTSELRGMLTPPSRTSSSQDACSASPPSSPGNLPRVTKSYNPIGALNTLLDMAVLDTLLFPPPLPKSGGGGTVAVTAAGSFPAATSAENALDAQLDPWELWSVDKDVWERCVALNGGDFVCGVPLLHLTADPPPGYGKGAMTVRVVSPSLDGTGGVAGSGGAPRSPCYYYLDIDSLLSTSLVGLKLLPTARSAISAAIHGGDVGDEHLPRLDVELCLSALTFGIGGFLSPFGWHNAAHPYVPPPPPDRRKGAKGAEPLLPPPIKYEDAAMGVLLAGLRLTKAESDSVRKFVVGGVFGTLGNMVREWVLERGGGGAAGGGDRDSVWNERLKWGRFVRAAGVNWPHNLALCAVGICLLERRLRGEGTGGDACEEEDRAVIDRVAALAGYITNTLGLRAAYEIKVKVDGKELIALLGAKGKGKAISFWMEKQVDWIMGSGGAEKEELVKWLEGEIKGWDGTC